MLVVRRTTGAVITRTFIAAVAIALALLVIPAAGSLNSGTYTINLTNKILTTRRFDHDVVTTALLFNRRIQNHSIGSSVQLCTLLGKGGVLGDGASWCNASFSLPKGSITVSGVVRNQFLYELSVTGGTGIYNNIMGGFVAQTIDARPRRQKLTFNLIAR
jgi:hypothetical protein